MKFAESRGEPLIVDDYLILHPKTSPDLSVGRVFADNQKEIIPSSYQLHQNYPNPFNPTTRIVFDLPQDEHVTLRVYDMLGKEILLLAEGPVRAGRHEVPVEMNRFPSEIGRAHV